MLSSRGNVELWLLAGMCLVLVASAGWLAGEYPSKAERLSHLQSVAPLPVAPSPEGLLARLQELETEAEPLRLVAVYVPARQPTRGLSAVYDVTRGATIPYRLFVVRHDVPCTGCGELLAAVVCDLPTRSIRHVLLLQPWVTGCDSVDAQPFTRQFVGRPATGRFEAGENLHILSGAKWQSQALIRCVNLVAQWMGEGGVRQSSKEADGSSPKICGECGS